MDENKLEDNGLPSDRQSHKPEGSGLPSDRQSQKKVDESWKERVEKDKLGNNGLASDSLSRKQEPKTKEGFVPPEADFKFFITTLTLQASIALGQIANPSTGKTEKDLIQAKFLIDTLSMLKEKTAGNLTEQESKLLETSVYELQLKYVQVAQQEKSSKDHGAQ